MTSNRDALERTIKSAPNPLGDQYAALCELCRVLAGQMDDAGDAGPSTRLTAAYLSALKDLNRALGARATGARGPSSRLEQLRTTAAQPPRSTVTPLRKKKTS